MRILSIFCLITLSFSLQAQRKLESSADILQEIKRLNVVGNVLYVAAHPDDENTRMISWLENEKQVRTAYLSLTRGDGGQNLIGTEKGDAMGVLRTQELLEARNEDGGEQFFTRVDDFGYSKTADETFKKWNKQEVLSDVVYVIRKFQPDVIITRFPPDSRGGHGHHTASSMLAEIAFKLSADPKAFPEQLKTLKPWQAKRILWDVYWWNAKIRDDAIAKGGIIDINIGDYNEILGLSYSEIASDSRSQHKSQGFGSARSRGNRSEYLQHTAGDQAEKDLFERIDLSWNRIPGSEGISGAIDELISQYKIQDPSASVMALLSLYEKIESLEASVYRTEKLKDIKRIIKAAVGIKAEALADKYNYVSSDSIKGRFILLHRSPLKISLSELDESIANPNNTKKLGNNDIKEFQFAMKGNGNAISHPYWLPYGNYEAMLSQTPEWRCLPQAPAIKSFSYTLNIEGIEMEFSEPIDYKWTDRVKGELHRDVIVSPDVTLKPSEKVNIFTGNEPQTISLIAEGNVVNAIQKISLKVPEGWKVEPSVQEFKASFIGEQKSLTFQLTPPKKPSTGTLQFMVNNQPARSVQRIEYDHMRPQIMFPLAEARIVKMNLATNAKQIGYVIGSGDEVAENLGQIGFEVKSFKAEQLPLMDLSQFETIVVGIRAYNTEESMKNGNTVLNNFVKQGGTVIVQYNTSRGLKSDKIGPYPLQLSRKRVTKEEAEPTLLAPKHPIFNQPNQLDEGDFENWVQERGLYFADQWDEKYTPLIAWNDPGEEPQKGSILVADYGEGKFIYTGISFFRQLPAGVPGAFRLLSNMISYGHE